MDAASWRGRSCGPLVGNKDAGGQTGSAWLCAGCPPRMCPCPAHPHSGHAVPLQARSLRWNGESKANGTLMRVAPLAVWGRQLPAETLADYARLDASLSHPNPACGDASAVYAIALASLVARPGDAAGALAAACEWAEAHAGALGVALLGLA